MRTPTRWVFSFLLLAAVGAVPFVQLDAGPDGSSANTPVPTARPTAERKIFTNEDLEALRNKGTISFAEAAPAERVSGGSGQAGADVLRRALAKVEPHVKEKDPSWYQTNLATWRAQLATIDSQVRRLREFRATGQGMTGGLILDQPGMRLSPENEIQQLGLERQQTEQQIADLMDTARRYEIAPGLLSAESPNAAAPGAQARPRFTRAERDALEDERTQAEAQLQEEKAQLDLANKEFDLTQREGTLFRSQFYSNPNYSSDSKGKGYVTALAGQQAAKQEQVEETQRRIAASETQLKALDRALGPRPAGPLTPEQQQEAWQARLRPQREELARVEAELASMRADAAARAFALHSETSTGSPPANLVRQLEARQAALRSQIENIEEEARRAGALAGWLR